MAEALTRDAFLGGLLNLWQPAQGYRAGIDPVLLAAAVEASAGQSVLDLGCGVGTALLCLGTRVPGLALTGIEQQADHAALARRNAAENALSAEVFCADLAVLPAEVRARRFDQVIANPPYFRRADGSASRSPAREAAIREATPLDLWVDVAARRLAPKGCLTLIQSVARLPELLTSVSARLGSLRLRPLQPRAGRAPHLVLLQARKGGRGSFVMLPPLVMHAGPAHVNDRPDYQPLVQAILRDGAHLPWSD